jgi:hypothetical protein
MFSGHFLFSSVLSKNEKITSAICTNTEKMF